MMPRVEAARDIDAPVERLWETLRDIERWPRWLPLVERVEPTEEADVWRLTGLLGRLPYAGAFRLVEYAPLERLYLESLVPSTPFDSLIHDLVIAPGPPASVTWRVHYDVGAGPGGWIMTTLLARRQAGPQLRAALAALADEVERGSAAHSD